MNFGSANNAGDEDALKTLRYAKLAIHCLLQLIEVQVPQCTLTVKAESREGGQHGWLLAYEA